MTSREEIVLALKYFFDVETDASVHEIIGQDDDPLGTIATALDEYRKVDSCEGWIKCSERMPENGEGLSRKAVEVESTAQHVTQEKRKPYAWAIEHKFGLPTVVFNKPNTNSWAFKDAVIKELYEAPDLEKSDDKS